MSKTRNINYYRLSCYDPNEGTLVTDLVAYGDEEAIEHAKAMTSKRSRTTKVTLYKYTHRDTCGSFTFLKTIKEPKATE